MNGLIDNLVEEGWLKTPRIIAAFKKIKRVDFLPEDKKNLCELNEALSIGHNQTISQPLVVAFMLELLNPEAGEKILDIGAGSGWTTALLAHCVSQEGNPNSKFKIPNGKIIAIELIPVLMEFGKSNVTKYNFIEKKIVQFVCGDGSRGFIGEAPFDKILCSAAVKQKGKAGAELPEAWKEQLKVGGRLVTPIGSSIWLFEKESLGKFKSKEYPGFAFVPLK